MSYLQRLQELLGKHFRQEPQLGVTEPTQEVKNMSTLGTKQIEDSLKFRTNTSLTRDRSDMPVPEDVNPSMLRSLAPWASDQEVKDQNVLQGIEVLNNITPKKEEPMMSKMSNAQLEQLPKDEIKPEVLPKVETPKKESSVVKPKVEDTSPQEVSVKPEEVPTETEDPLDVKLREAQAERRAIEQASLIGHGGERILSGLVKAGGGDYKPDTEFYDRLSRLASTGIKEVEEDVSLRKSKLSLEKEGMDLQNEKLLNDPNSDISKEYRNIAEDLLGRKLDTKVSASQLIKTIPLIQQKAAIADRQFRAMEAAKDRQLRREELMEMSRRRDEDRDADRKIRINNAYNQFLQQAEKDPLFKKLQEQRNTFESIDQFVKMAEKGNEAAVGALGTQLARAMGEVGVLTESDVTRYLPNASYANKVRNWMAKGFEGKIPKGSAEDIKALGNMIKRVNEEKLSKIYDRYAVRFAESFPDAGDTVEERLGIAYRRLGAPQYRSEAAELVKQMSQERETVKIKAPDGKVRLIPKSKLKDALDAGGKLVE